MNEALPSPVLDHACAIIMAGGKGERFWPMSTAARPKQLLALTGGDPLLMQAVKRLLGLIPPERILIVTNASLVAPIREMLGDLPVGVLGEPVGRDTAAAIAAGAAWFKRRDPQAVMCVLTADHLIGDLPIFQKTLRQALHVAQVEEALITIGIPPREASSAYGYIETGGESAHRGEVDFLRVKRFVEKPDASTAAAYLAAGNYLWNSGMFIWSLQTLEKAFAAFYPALAECLQEWGAAADDEGLQRLLERDFPGMKKISIDYALMEKAQNILVCPGRFSWDDVGSWTALDAHLPKDEAGNAVLGDVVALDADRNIVVSPNHLTALIGVEDLVVAQAEGVTLICPKARAQEIKQLLAKLTAQGGRGTVL